jgi:Tfp pilus assembly protein PilO
MIMTVLAVALLLGFWMMVLTPQRKAAADAKAQVETAKTALTAAQSKVTSGKKAQAAFRKDRATIVKIGRAVPESDDIPTLITQLETLAKKYDVYFIDYTVAAASGPAGGGGSSAPSSSASSSSSVSQSGTEKGANSSTNAVAPLYPPGSVQMGNLGRTPILIGLRGQYFSLERYLRAVQRFAVLSQTSSKAKGRLMIVDGFSYKAGDLIFRKINGKKENTERWLEAELGASVYFAPPLQTPSTATPAAPAAGAATPAAGSTPAAPSTGTATVGGLR